MGHRGSAGLGAHGRCRVWVQQAGPGREIRTHAGRCSRCGAIGHRSRPRRQGKPLPAGAESSRECREPQSVPPLLEYPASTSGCSGPGVLWLHFSRKIPHMPLAAVPRGTGDLRMSIPAPTCAGSTPLHVAPGWLQDPTIPRADVLGHLHTRWHFGDSQIWQQEHSCDPQQS